MLHKEKREYIEFWNLAPEKFKTLQKCARSLLTSRIFANNRIHVIFKIYVGIAPF